MTLAHRYRIIDIDVESGIVYCAALVKKIPRAYDGVPADESGEVIEHEDFLLPVSLPIFGVGPPPYIQFKHPVEGSSDLSWVKQEKGIVYRKSDKSTYKLMFDSVYVITGTYYLLPVGESGHPIKLEGQRRTREDAETALASVKGAVYDGETVKGVVTYIEMRSSGDSTITQSVDPTLMKHRLEKNKVEVVVFLEVSGTFMEIGLPIHLVKRAGAENKNENPVL